MGEEEKEAIEYLKGKFEFFEEDDTLAKWDYEAINTMLGLIDKLQKELKLKDKVIDNLYADIEYEYSGTNYLKSIEEYYKESDTDE